jgi:flagellar assembly protein FliH
MLQRYDTHFLRDFRDPIAIRETIVAALEEAAPPPPPPPPTFSEDELEQAKAAGKALGYAEGVEAGLKQAATEAAAREKDMAAALASIVEHFQTLSASHQEFMAQQTPELAELALLIARKVAEEALDARGVDVIAALVTKCIPVFLEKAKVVIELHPDMIDNAKDAIRALLTQQGFEGDAQFRTNESLQKHDARIDWGNGQATRSSEVLWKTIEALLYENTPNSTQRTPSTT